MQMEEVEVVKEEPLEPVESAVSVQEPMDNNWLWICGERPQPGANMDEWMPMPISHLYPDDPHSDQHSAGFVFIHVPTMERALCHHKLERFIVKAVTTSHPNCSGRSENTDSGFDDGSATEGDMPDELSETISNGQDRDEGQDDNEEEYYDAGDESEVGGTGQFAEEYYLEGDEDQGISVDQPQEVFQNMGYDNENNGTDQYAEEPSDAGMDVDSADLKELLHSLIHGQDPSAADLVNEVAKTHDNMELGGKRGGMSAMKKKCSGKQLSKVAKKGPRVWPFACVCGQRFGKRARLTKHCKSKPLEHYPVHGDCNAYAPLDPQRVVELACGLELEAEE